MSSNPAQTREHGFPLPHLVAIDLLTTEASALKSEISGLQSLEEQLFDEIQSMESRRRAMEMSGTLRGRLWSFIGYMFTFYCIARTLLSAISLLIGLDKASNVQEGGRTPLPTLLAGAASIIGLDIDVTTWSQLVSQGLVGVIILVNIRMVLGAVSRVSLPTQF